MTVSDMSKQKAVAYVRVSSEAQVRRGQGAESQAARCAEYARMKGYEIVRVFEDKAVSGGMVDRPGMKAMLAFIRKNRSDHMRVIIDDISRLARGLEAHLTLRTAISSAGGVLESPSIEFGEDSDSQLIEHLLASVSQHARVKNAEQTRNRMEARIRQGYWPFLGCIGFKFQKIEGHGNLLVRNEPLASIIQEGLEGFASGRFQTQAEVKRYFESRPEFPKNGKGRVRNQYVNDILTRVLYAGMVERPEWGVSLRQGKHQGLISFETFQKIQERLEGRAYAPARSDINHDFPLRGAVDCACCGHTMTACWSKSKTGTKHPYYMCFLKGCPDYRKSIRRADMEMAFEDMLRQLVPGETYIDLITVMFRDAWTQQAGQAKAAMKAVQDKLSTIEKDITALLDRIVAATNERVVTAYEARIDKLEKEKLVIVERLHAEPAKYRPFEEVFELTLKFLSNPYNIWKNGRAEDRKTVLRLVFSEPLKFARNEGFRTPKTSSVFNALKRFEGLKGGLAERKGFEPSIRVNVYALSRGAPSATRPPLQRGIWGLEKPHPDRKPLNSVEPSKSPRKHGQTQMHAQLLHMWRYVWSAHPSVLISPLILARDPDNDDRLFQTRPVRPVQIR